MLLLRKTTIIKKVLCKIEEGKGYSPCVNGEIEASKADSVCCVSGGT